MKLIFRLFLLFLMDPKSKFVYTLDSLFGNGVSKNLPKNLDFTFSRKTGRIRSVLHDGKLLCTLRIDGGLAITTHFAQILLKGKKFKENCLEVDKDSKPFVEDGKSVFCKHVTWCGNNIMISSDVPILYKNKVIAVGKAVLSSEMIQSQKIGVAIKVRDSLKSQKKGLITS